MKLSFCAVCVVVGAMLSPVTGAYADDIDRDHPMHLVKDSAITVLIKTRLAADKLSSLRHVSVETDDQGVVWLGGTAPTQTEINQAESIARSTDGVRAVKNHITVSTDK